MTQNLFFKDLPYFVIPCDMSLIQHVGFLFSFNLFFKQYSWTKNTGPGIRAWLKHFKSMYRLGFNFLYCSMNVIIPNNVILSPFQEKLRCFQNVEDRTLKDLNEMEAVMIRL